MKSLSYVDLTAITYDIRYDTMPFYLGALRMLNIATGYSTYTLSCSELNGEHAGEGFRSLRHILLPLWACKSQKCRFSRKIDLWPDLTRSNVNLQLKLYMQSRDLVETHRLVFSAKLYDHQGPIARGVVQPPFPPLAKVAKYGKRARVKKTPRGG